MRKFTISLVFVSLLGLSLIAVAEGTNAGSFARDGIGARAIALGGAFVAIADDTSTGFWNPAGVAYLEGYNLGGMYVIGGQFGISDIKYQDLSLLVKPRLTQSSDSLPVGLGITWINHVVSGIPYSGDDGTGTFSDDESLFLISIGGPIALGDWSLGIGANLKYYLHSLLTGRGSGVGFDLGFLLNGNFGEVPVSFGFVSTDSLETAIRWRGTEHNPVNYVPWIVKVGASAALLEEKLRLSVGIDYSPLAIHSDLTRYPDLDRLHVGIEVNPVKQLSLRGGLIIWRDGAPRWSLGVGLAPLEGLVIDYAYEREQRGLGNRRHILSAHFAFSSIFKEKEEQ